MSYDYILKVNGQIITMKNIEFRPNVIAEIVEDVVQIGKGINSFELSVFVCTGKGDQRKRKQ